MRPAAPSYDGRNRKRPRGQGMATNKKKILITESFSPKGRELFKDRDDIEIGEFSNMISAADFEPMLKQQAPVHGVALGAPRFGEPELEASGDMRVVSRI